MIAQSHQDWAIIVVDDGSSDATADVVARFSDPRIRLVRQSNAGVSAARNRGLGEVSGDAVLFLDGDDWLAPDALARLTAALEVEPHCVAAYGAFCFVTEAGVPVRYKRGPFPSGAILERLLEENMFANGGHMLIRRSALEAVGLFRTDLAYGEDWECWIRLAASGRLQLCLARSRYCLCVSADRGRICAWRMTQRRLVRVWMRSLAILGLWRVLGRSACRRFGVARKRRIAGSLGAS